MHGAAMWASCRRAPTTRFLDEGTTPTTTSTKFRATRCYRSWAMHRRRDAWQTDAETVELLVWYVHLVYTHHCMTYDISYQISIYLSIHPFIHPSIYLSIHPSIYLPTYILLILLQGGFLFDDWFYFCILLFLFGDIYGPFFFLGGVFNYWHIIVYYSVIWDHEVDKIPSQSLINN